MTNLFMHFARRRLFALTSAFNCTVLTFAATIAILGASATVPQTSHAEAFACAGPVMCAEA